MTAALAAKGSGGRIPSEATNALRACRELEDGEHMLHFVLDELKQFLQLQPPPIVPADEIARLQAELSKVPEEYRAVAESLKAAITARFLQA